MEDAQTGENKQTCPPSIFDSAEMQNSARPSDKAAATTAEANDSATRQEKAAIMLSKFKNHMLANGTGCKRDTEDTRV